MSQRPVTITPPESFTDSPLTPPLSDSKRDSKRTPSDQISRIINRVRHAQAGHNVQDQQPWCVFQLLPGDLEHLFSFFRDDEDEKLWPFFRDKVRYDYDSRTCRLSLRMPTPIHEIFLTSVTENIRDQLKKVTTGTSRVAADFAKNVDSKGSIALKYEVDGTENQGLSRVSRHEPDGTFKHREAQDPSIIIEISYSQKRKALTDLAEFYILGSDGNVQRVIGLDIEYKATKKATLSVWQPEYISNKSSEELITTQALVAQEFRDQDGNPNDKNPGLVLSLQDFATEALIEDPSVLTQQITISSSELCSMLTSAEAEAKQGEENRGKRMAMKGSGRKRWRTRTPPEELDSDDERELLAEEESAAKRIQGNMGLFRGGRRRNDKTEQKCHDCRAFTSGPPVPPRLWPTVASKPSGQPPWYPTRNLTVNSSSLAFTSICTILTSPIFFLKKTMMIEMLCTQCPYPSPSYSFN